MPFLFGRDCQPVTPNCRSLALLGMTRLLVCELDCCFFYFFSVSAGTRFSEAEFMQ